MKTMHLKQLLLGCVVILSVMAPALADTTIIPNTINYQGRLTDSGGAPVNGAVGITFALYTAASGGSPVWNETQASVAVNQGVFNVELGAVSPLNPGIFSVPLYLGVKVGADAEMTPRQALSSVPYSIRVDNNVITKVTAGTGLTGGGLNGDVTLGADTNYLQRRVSGNCPSGQSIRTVNTDGTVVCETDDNYTNAEAVTAMGAKADGNPLHHDRYADAAAVAAIKAADGTGSTLDADLLDGLHASAIIAAGGGEVRTAISALPYTIASAGSYYLTGDLTATGATGITVNANHVTIDLMGFSIIGNGTAYYGIYMIGRDNVEIRNGTVRGFGKAGIYEGYASSEYHRIIDMRVVGNGVLGTTDAYSGIYLSGNNHRVQDSTAADNGGYGIFAGNGATVTGNTVYNNQGTGIYAYYGATVTGNTADYNQGTYGIYVYSASTVTGNTAYYNQGWGINAGFNSTVKDNTVSNNNQSNTSGQAGIGIYRDSQIKGNTVNSNKQNNILASSSDNIIEENLVTDSTNGIYFAAGGNFYANNRASGNTTNYAGSVPTGSGDGGGNVGF